MAAPDIITQLGSWEGYEVEACWEEQRGTQRWWFGCARPQDANGNAAAVGRAVWPSMIGKSGGFATCRSSNFRWN